MAPNAVRPAGNENEVTEKSPLLSPKKSQQFVQSNYYTTTNATNNDKKPHPTDADQMEGQFCETKTSCFCNGRMFSIGFIGLILIGGTTVGSYLLHQFDREWVTNAPFELVDRRTWRSADNIPRVRNSRSETRTRQPSDHLEKLSWGESATGINQTPDADDQKTPLFQEQVLELIMEQGMEAKNDSKDASGRVTKKRSSIATHVVIAHTEGRSCSKRHQCLQIMRQLQARSITELGLLDVPYNFLVGGDGQTYEGRGWFGNDALQHSLKNHTTISIAFIGDFNNATPPRRQLDEAKALIIESIRRRKLSPHYSLVGHRQINDYTDSPGDFLMRELSGWRHWRPCSKNDC